MYQQVYLQSVANTAAERGAAAWSNPSKDMFIEQIKTSDMKNASLYWRLTEILPVSKASETKKTKVEEYVKYSLKQYSLLGKRFDNKEVIKSDISETVVSCEIKDYIIYKKLVVDVTEKYTIPIGSSLLRPFGFSGQYPIRVKAEAVINEPSEFIRNTDFVVGTIREYDTKSGGNLTEIWNKINGSFSGLSDKLKDFLD
jgi:hypothetical protein